GGGALFGRFVLSPHERLWHYGSLRRWQDVQFFPRFVRSAAVRSALPHLGRGGGISQGSFDTPIPEADCCYGRAATLLQEMTATFPRWAVSRLRGPAAVYCGVLLGDRPEDVGLCWSWSAWAPWFNDLDHDYTWVTIDGRDWTVTLLCMTDANEIC